MTVNVLTAAECGLGAGAAAVQQAAAALLGLPQGDAIVAILEQLCLGGHYHRAWMYEYNADMTRFRNTFDWQRPPGRTTVYEVNEAPVTMIAWLHAQIVRGDAVAINDIAAMPAVARPLQQELERDGDRSVLCVPMLHGGRVLGCIGLNDVETAHVWTREEAGLLFAVGALVAASRFRARDEANFAVERGIWFKPLVYLRRQGGMRGVSFDEMLGLRSARDYSEVWLADGSHVLDHRSLSTWEAMLPTTDFQRIHRTAIVNLTKIADLDHDSDIWRLRLRSIAEPWRVSRAYRQELKRRLGL